MWDDSVSEFEWILCGLGDCEQQRHFRHLETFQGFRNYFSKLETKARPLFGKDQILYCISCYENSSNIVSKCLIGFPYLGDSYVSLGSHILGTAMSPCIAISWRQLLLCWLFSIYCSRCLIIFWMYIELYFAYCSLTRLFYLRMYV